MKTLEERNLYQRCGKIKGRQATDKELCLTHNQLYIDSIKQLKTKTEKQLKHLSNIDSRSVYFHFDTYESASHATGSILSVIDAVCTNKYVNGVAISRPPGHHAMSDECGGFCFFNTIAVNFNYF